MMVQQSKDYFHYFAYGSNLLKRRIHINNPSAVFLGIGRLDDRIDHSYPMVSDDVVGGERWRRSNLLLRLGRNSYDQERMNGRNRPVLTSIICIKTAKDTDDESKNHRLDFVHVPYYSHWQGAVATIVPDESKHVWGAVWKMQNDCLITLDKQEGVEDKQYFPKEVDISGNNGRTQKCRTYQHFTVPPYLKSLACLPDDRKPSITYKQCIVNGALECGIPDDYIQMLKNIPNNGLHAADDLRKRLDL